MTFHSMSMGGDDRGRDRDVDKDITVSVILPVYNAAFFLEEALDSILSQTFTDEETSVHCIEVSVWDDGSTDGSLDILEKFMERVQGDLRFRIILSRNGDRQGHSRDFHNCDFVVIYCDFCDITNSKPRGVGFGRNRAIEQCSGEYFCFFDADDIMEPTRILKQYKLAVKDNNAIVGCQFQRLPSDSTENYSFWANNLPDSKLGIQVLTTYGPTIIMPTWFCHKSVYHKVQGGFNEGGKGVPEDLIFFYSHLDNGGTVKRVPESLLTYRYHPQATTFSVSSETIFGIRLNRLETRILPNWKKFSIWNAGKSGRRLYRSLRPENKIRVSSFIDVDPQKLSQGLYEPHPNPEKVKIPILKPSDAKPPFLVCLKMELLWDECGPFHNIVKALSLQEGKDFVCFN